MRFLIMLAVLPALGAAQDAPTRGLAFGLARDASGEPWPAARVTLLSRPVPGNEQLGSADRIDVVTDDRGRFRANVLPYRPYSVWAVQDEDGDNYRHTDIVEDVFANVPVILQEAGPPRPRTALRIRGTEAWSDRAPLHVQLVGKSVNTFVVPLQIDPAGRTLLPPLAGASCTVEVYGRNGQLLWQEGISLADHDDPAVHVSVPPPFPILVSVRNKAGTTTLVGARIRQRVRQGWAPVAVTGADGIAVLELAMQRTDDGRAVWQHRVLFAEADDHSSGSLITVKMDLAQDKDPDALRSAGVVDAHAGLEPAPMLTGRLWLGPEVPAAGIDLMLYGRYASFRNGSSTAGTVVQFLTTDADGRFSVTSPRTGNGFRLCAVLDESHLAQLFPGAETVPHPIALVAHDSQSTPTGGTLGDLRLDALCPLDISVSHEDRTPAPHAALGYAELSEPAHDLDPSVFVADRHGRQRLLIPTTNQLLVGAVHGGAGEVLSTRLTVPAGVGEPVALEVVLREPSHIRGQVFSTAGTPLSGAAITCFPTYRNRNSNRAPRSTVIPVPVDQNTITVLANEQWETNWALTSQLLQGMLAYADQDGEFSMPVPTPALQYYVRAAFRKDGSEHLSSTIAVRFRDEASERVDLTIDLR